MVDGVIVMLASFPGNGVPPQELAYQCQLALTPSEPPESVSLMMGLDPVLPTTVCLIPVGAVEAVQFVPAVTTMELLGSVEVTPPQSVLPVKSLISEYVPGAVTVRLARSLPC